MYWYLNIGLLAIQLGIVSDILQLSIDSLRIHLILPSVRVPDSQVKSLLIVVGFGEGLVPVRFLSTSIMDITPPLLSTIA